MTTRMRRPWRRAAELALLGLALAASGCARRPAVSDAWIRLLPGDLPAAGYFVLHNGGDAPITLVGAAAPDFGSVGLHRSMQHDGEQMMMPVDAVPVPAHDEARFAPGGYHLMLMQPRRTLSVGETERITLRLDDGSEIAANFAVRGPAASSPGGG